MSNVGAEGFYHQFLDNGFSRQSSLYVVMCNRICVKFFINLTFLLDGAPLGWIGISNEL